MSSDPTCNWCGKAFQRLHTRGPVPKYCSEAHRQQAYRARQLRRFADSAEFVADRDVAARNFLMRTDPAALSKMVAESARAFDPAALSKMVAESARAFDPAALSKMVAEFGAQSNHAQQVDEADPAVSPEVLVFILALLAYYLLKRAQLPALAAFAAALINEAAVFIRMADQIQDESPFVGGVLSIASAAAIVSWVVGIVRRGAESEEALAPEGRRPDTPVEGRGTTGGMEEE